MSSGLKLSLFHRQKTYEENESVTVVAWSTSTRKGNCHWTKANVTVNTWQFSARRNCCFWLGLANLSSENAQCPKTCYASTDISGRDFNSSSECFRLFDIPECLIGKFCSSHNYSLCSDPLSWKQSVEQLLYYKYVLLMTFWKFPFTLKKGWLNFPQTKSFFF